MQARIFPGDGFEDFAYGFPAGHDFGIAASVLAQLRWNMYCDNRRFAEHDDAPFRWCP